MSGYRRVQRQKFIHYEDKCPGNEVESTWKCASYKDSTKAIVGCAGHRGVDRKRSMRFESYKSGSIVKAQQINTLRENLKAELKERKKHKWYKSLKMDGKDAEAGKTAYAEQEVDVLNSISALSHSVYSGEYGADSGLSWKISNALYKSLQAEAGSTMRADMIKQLQQYTLSAHRDCICYADCTQHGLSTWYECVYCGSYNF